MAERAAALLEIAEQARALGVAIDAAAALREGLSPEALARRALAEAARGGSSFSVDRLLLYCFHYDPQARSYVLFATNFMKAGAALSVLAVAAVLARLWKRERHAARAQEKVA
jgi:hypothetical protein